MMAANVSQKCHALVQAVHDFEKALTETCERIELVQMLAELDWQSKLGRLSNERAQLEQERRALGQGLATTPVAAAGLGGLAPQPGARQLRDEQWGHGMTGAAPSGHGMMGVEPKDEKEELPSHGAMGLGRKGEEEELTPRDIELGPMKAYARRFSEPAWLEFLPSPGDPQSGGGQAVHSKVPVDGLQASSAPWSGPVPKPLT
eukprot:CAMPEP_0179287990 /NCGR_PEP_ID=MMETSP0797-20121207/40553_1 /TAXON_ID=47934 /ORGANISM="Dinophysis acuminata, Strain DAEP01" /LENGTH=202 /DNA_ID=CAMNT_0020996945 /DNA_START=63 /DNA_END=668 /DNA_ORIENTATION=+